MSTTRQILLALTLSAGFTSIAEAQAPPHAATLFGGSLFDRAQGIAVDQQGNVIAVGNTHSTSLVGFSAAKGGFAKTHAGGDASDGYIAKFSPDLTTLLAWTYFGGTGDDRIYSVVPVADGYWIEGWTESTDLPKTTGPGLGGSRDIYVAKLSLDLKQAPVVRYLGGAGTDQSRGAFAVDAAQNVFVCGSVSTASGLPLISALNATFAGGASDTYIAKLGPTGTILWSTLLGGAGEEACYGLALHPSDGSVYGAGYSNSTNFPTTAGALQLAYAGPSPGPVGSGDGIVFRLAPSGASLVYATYLGGSAADMVAENHGLVVDGSGRAFVIGRTQSGDFPTSPGAYRSTLSGMTDLFVAGLSASGAQLVASTLIGGAEVDNPSGIAFSPTGEVYITGDTASTDFPVTAGALQATYGGGNGDIYLARFSANLSALEYSTLYGGGGSTAFGDRGRDLEVTPAGVVFVGGDTNSPGFPTTAGVFDQSYNGGSADAVLLRVDFAAGSSPDGGVADGGVADGGTPDAGSGDAGGSDASSADAGASSDASAGDASSGDAGMIADASAGDAGAIADQGADAGPSSASGGCQLQSASSLGLVSILLALLACGRRRR